MTAFPKVEVSPATIDAIVAHLALGTRTATPLAHRGTSHTIYLLDDAFVLRIPANHPACISSVRLEAIAVPVARAAGVHTPALIAVDETLGLLPVPYAIYERVHGISLDQLDLAPDAIPDVWRQIGQDLARLHSGIVRAGPLAQIPVDEADRDPRPWLSEIAAAGFIPQDAVAYLEAWLEQLAPLALKPPLLSFCHGDMNVSNVLVDPQSRAYLALIDWASVWTDSAWDFAVVSLRAVPCLLEGYRSIAPMPEDATAEARILWHHLRMGLYGMRRAPQLGQPWATRRLERLLAGMRAFLAAPCAQWLAKLGPKQID